MIIVIVTATFALPSHAADISATYNRWNALRNPTTERIRFLDGAKFLYEYPGWPEEKTIRLRTEAAALFENPEREVMEKFCAHFSPIS